MEGLYQFADNICEPALVLLRLTNTIRLTSSLYVHSEVVYGIIWEALKDFITGISNQLMSSPLIVVGQWYGGSNENIVLIPNSI